MDTLRVGLIGTGKHGSRYAAHLVDDIRDRFQLTAISRRSAAGREQAATWGTNYYPDWRELVAAEEVDAVISVTPPNLNLEIGRACVRARKPLLIEKPLTTDYPSGRELVNLFATRQLSLTVAQTLRYNSVILGLRRHLPEMGRIFSFSISHRLEPSTLSWLEQPEVAGGGVIFHTGVHLLDALRYITGDEVVAVRASSARVYNKHLEDLLVAELRLAEGSLGVIDTSKVSPARVARYEFVCERGILQGDQIHGILEKVRGMEVQTLEVEPPGPTLLPLLRDWHSHLVGSGPNPVSGEQGLAAVRLCAACRQAIAVNSWITPDDL